MEFSKALRKVFFYSFFSVSFILSLLIRSCGGVLQVDKGRMGIDVFFPWQFWEGAGAKHTHGRFSGMCWRQPAKKGGIDKGKIVYQFSNENLIVFSAFLGIVIVVCELAQCLN
ncbi:hypothetical protein QR685DRAFT_140094 [Neurospora intermedia]|uniref:Uncharacterized protein n=1 Tax=Neurospora intermedia TaxID=5142 RepID=A0ABR3CYA9_NEUIN